MRISQSYILILVLVCLCCMSISNAQDTPNSPIIELLSTIPDTPEVRQSFIYYADVESSIRLRGTPPLESYEAWLSLSETDDPLSNLQRRDWLNALPWRVLDSFTRSLQRSELKFELTGIDIFSIHQTVQVINPPNDIAIIAGDFDEEAVRSAYETRGYTQQDNPNFLCPESGCNSTMEGYLENRQPNNIFEENLANYQSIGLLDDLVFSSPSESLMQSLFAVQTGESPSIMDDAIISTSIHAMLDLGEIRAATLVMNTEVLRVFTEETIDEMDAPIPLPDNLDLVPDFEFFALADTVDLENGLQRAAIVLVYENEADAQSATDAIIANFNNPDLFSTELSRPFAGFFEDREINLLADTIYVDAETGYYAARIVLAQELVHYGTIVDDRGNNRQVVEAFPQDGTWQVVQSSLNYVYLLEMLTEIDFAWLYLGVE